MPFPLYAKEVKQMSAIPGLMQEILQEIKDLKTCLHKMHCLAYTAHKEHTGGDECAHLKPDYTEEHN